MSDRDPLDASLPALHPQIRLTLTQIRLTPDAAAALRRLGADLQAHEEELKRLEQEAGEALVQRRVAEALLKRARTEARTHATETLAWVRACRASRPRNDQVVRPWLTLEVARFSGGMRCLQAALPALETTGPAGLVADGRALLQQGSTIEADLIRTEADAQRSAAEVDALRTAARSALRALRKVWSAATELPPLNLSHAARSVR